jgi:hypothetical protein
MRLTAVGPAALAARPAVAGGAPAASFPGTLRRRRPGPARSGRSRRCRARYRRQSASRGSIGPEANGRVAPVTEYTVIMLGRASRPWSAIRKLANPADA